MSPSDKRKKSAVLNFYPPSVCQRMLAGAGFHSDRSGTRKDMHVSKHPEQVEGHTCVWGFGCMGLGNCQLPNLAPVLIVFYSVLC